jgi:hypothetical protein
MGLGRELLLGLGSALGTTGGLFAAQLWYASYLDVEVVHGALTSAPLDVELLALRKEEQAKLGSGRMPIDEAMHALAQRGRGAFPLLAVKPSDDLSAMSGWVHRPGFKPYVPAPAAVPGGPAGREPNGREPNGK